MNHVHRSFSKIVFSITLPLVLLACGGGGGGGGTSANNVAGKASAELVPTSGTYVPVLVVNGTNDLEVSAANSEFPNKEFVWTAQTVRAKSASITYSGDISADGTISNYAANRLITVSDFLSGGVFLTPGGRPVYLTTPSTNKLCQYKARSGWLAFGVDSPLASSSSLNPPLIRAGLDNTCGTADDVSDETFVASFYDPSSQQIAISYFTDNLRVKNPDEDALIIGSSGLAGKTPRSVGDPYKTVLNAPNAALFEDRNQLWLLRPIIGPNSNYWSTTDARSVVTTVDWEPIGYDENALYVYRNSSKQVGFGDWQVLKVDIATGVGTLLDSGTGSVTPAMGQDQIWVTAMTSNTGSTRVIYKNGGIATVKSIYFLSAGVSIPVSAGGGRIVFYSVRTGFSGFEVYNESTGNLYQSIPNAYLSGFAGTGPLSIKKSRSVGVVYVQQPSVPAAGGHAGGTLSSYDPVIDQVITYGVLAQAPIGGYSSAVGVPLSNQTAFKSWVLQGFSGNDVFAAGSKKYSFTFGQANSLNELVSKVQLND